MKMQRLAVMIAVLTWIIGANAFAEKIKVTFINPGFSDKDNPTGGFWNSVSSFMQAAAEDLEIDLETIYSNRDYVLSKKQAEEVAARSQKPDYLIIVNEKQGAGSMLESAQKAGIKTFIMLNVFADDQAKTYGEPRGKYDRWFGSLIPNNFSAGYDVAKALVEAAESSGVKGGDGKIHVVAISGDKATQASIEREGGLRKLISEKKNAVLDQVFYAEWSKDNSFNQTRGFLASRYKNAGVIWCANDPIALGALEAAIAVGRKPGTDILIGGLNWDKPALEKVKSAELVTSVGGHFMTGGWAMVMIHDYHKGKDFALENRAAIQYPIFGSLQKSNIDSYLAKFGEQDWKKIDFRKFSRVHNPSLKKYEFSLEALFSQ